MFESEIIEDYKIGIDTSALIGGGSKTSLRRGVNLLLGDKGGARVIGGQEKLFDSLPAPISAFAEYVSKSSRYILYSISGAMAGDYNELLAYNRISHDHIDLGDFGGNVTDELGITQPVFAQAGSKIYFTGVPGVLSFWDGDESTDHKYPATWTGQGTYIQTGTHKYQVAGIPAYPYPAVAAIDGAGNLQNAAPSLPDYHWHFTFYDSLTQTESDASPINTLTDTIYNNQKAKLTITTNQGGTEYEIPLRTTHLRLYRMGGNIATPRRSVEVALDMAHLTTTDTGYTGYVEVSDNVSDDEVSLILMPTVNHLPPIFMDSLILHRNRLFGAASLQNLVETSIADTIIPSRLYYSTRGKFEYWPQSDSGLAADGGFIDIDNDHKNAIIALASTGSILVVGRTGSVHALLGTNASNWQPSQRGDVGVLARKSFIRCGNRICWLGTDRHVYQLGDSDPVSISEDIDTTLKAVSEATIINACATYFDGRYILIIPQGGGAAPVAFAYDFDKEHWEDFRVHTFAATEIHTLSPAVPSGTQEFILATESGYTDGADASYNGLVRTLFDTPVSSGYIPFRLTTTELNFGIPGIRKRLQYILVEGGMTLDPDHTSTVTITSDTGKTTTLTIPPALNGFLLNTRIGMHMTGNYFTVDVNGKGRNGDIRHIELFYSRIGEMRR